MLTTASQVLQVQTITLFQSLAMKLSNNENDLRFVDSYSRDSFVYIGLVLSRVYNYLLALSTKITIV